MKVAAWLARASARLAQRKNSLLQPCPTPRLDSELLLAHAAGKSRTWLYTWPDADLDSSSLSQANALLERRAAGMPVAYLTGHREFHSLEFEVTPAVLIPRPDTELLVELAAHALQRSADQGCIFELGTGSGAVAVALAMECGQPVIATDISNGALAVAARNVARHCPGRVSLMQGHWLAAIAERCASLIISNPPYLACDDPHLQSAELAAEPASALVSGKAGLDDLSQILEQCKRVALPGCTVLLEHGATQGAPVRQLMEHQSLIDVSSHRDLAGNERVTVGRCP